MKKYALDIALCLALLSVCLFAWMVVKENGAKQMEMEAIRRGYGRMVIEDGGPRFQWVGEGDERAAHEE